MSETPDIVVAGGGHNSLITACYLAKAGFEVRVLDARPIPGGGAATEELLIPGFKLDSCSTGHTLIRVNPLLLDDELGLHAEYGLEYLEPDPVAHVGFPDGEQLTMWLDLERTCLEISRFSPRDADAYRRMLAEYDEVKEAFAAARITPHGFGPSLEELLLAHPRGRIWLRRNAISAWEIIRREFESRHVRAFMLWMAFQTLVAADAAGSGTLAYSLIFGRQRRSWSIPRGGSGSLTEALVRCLEDHGGTVLCERQVSSLILEGGRCAGVETADGERHLARTAVLSTIHVKHLVEMAPPEAWGEEFLYGAETYDAGMPGMAAYFAATEAPLFQTADGDRSAVSAGPRTSSAAGATSRTGASPRTCRGCWWPPRRSWTRVARRKATTRSSCSRPRAGRCRRDAAGTTSRTRWPSASSPRSAASARGSPTRRSSPGS
jgi:phytoene dehydrogenase-like protein